MTCVLMIIVLLFCARLNAEEPHKADVEALIKKLGLEDFEARETATKALQKMGPEIRDQVEDWLDKTADQEIKVRLTQVLRHLPGGARLGKAVVAGTVRFKGVAPARIKIDVSGDRQIAELYKNGEALLSERIIVGEKGELANVLIYVSKGLEEYKFQAPAEALVIDQIKGRFDPHVSGMMANQQVLIRNMDSLVHNVHGISPTRANPEFNLSQTRLGTEDAKRLSSSEVCFHIKCDIHQWMQCHVGVFEHPYFIVSGKDGAYALHGLPEGKFTLTAWHEKFGTQSAEIEVGKKQRKELHFTFEPK